MSALLGKLFNKTKKVDKESIFSPLEGEAIPLEKVSDPVFAQKMMGEGIAVIPKSGKLVSPVEGKIVQVFPTKHAIGIQSVHGLEVLIHVGIDTVALKGEGFDVVIKEGQQVKVGDPILTFDIPFLQSQNKEITTPIIITNTDEKVANVEHEFGPVNQQDPLFTCIFK
ncbi:PTS sugar transporter subunit IIA [Alkalihalobacterium bogoriense]|uniref:PTS sugar transporter subunit IIA n=1 Tax=Alkalihalobacterium bogoriense TaxID=246272 RepID=UPI003571355B